MTDLINRSDAITVIIRWLSGEELGADIIDLINSLPSAEQVTSKLKNPCDSLLTDDSGECKEKKSKLDLISRADAIEAVKQAIYNHDSAIMRITSLPSAEAVQGWIPCSERLPKREEKTYWVCTDTEYQCECRWTNNRFGISEGEWGWSIFDTPQYTKPVAWMPLPKPWKGADDEAD